MADALQQFSPDETFVADAARMFGLEVLSHAHICHLSIPSLLSGFLTNVGRNAFAISSDSALPFWHERQYRLDFKRLIFMTSASYSSRSTQLDGLSRHHLATGDRHQLELVMATYATLSKLQFSGHETFPLRQLWLRKAFVAVSDSVNGDAVFTDKAAVKQFGVGKNMVAAIRHWALATGVLVESAAGGLEAGEIGEFLFGFNGVDQYLERPATCWLIHWQLAGRAQRSTTWHWLFNRMTHQTFDRDAVVAGLAELAADRRVRASATTLKRDVEVCLRCYLTRRDGREADDAAEPLLAELGLITEGPSGIFHFRRSAQPSLPDAVFAYALVEFWESWEIATGSSQNTLSFEVIAHDYGSPGRVFKLDEASVAERLLNLEALTNGAFRWSDSAGLRQVSRARPLTRKTAFNLLRKAYGR